MPHGDGKFEIIGGDIVKKSNGEIIPEDEPIMIFRARDWLAIEVIEFYMTLCEQDGATDYQIAGCKDRLDAFREFEEKHPDRMKQPGITKGR